jgi:hypothetical protein
MKHQTSNLMDARIAASIGCAYIANWLRENGVRSNVPHDGSLTEPVSCHDHVRGKLLHVLQMLRTART